MSMFLRFIFSLFDNCCSLGSVQAVGGAMSGTYWYILLCI
jgi:hypothetical protein